VSAVLDLCDRWDALSNGESPATKAIRAAHAEDQLAREPRCPRGNPYRLHVNPCGLGCNYPAQALRESRA
jgi:hypothetical protein